MRGPAGGVAHEIVRTHLAPRVADTQPRAPGEEEDPFVRAVVRVEGSGVRSGLDLRPDHGLAREAGRPLEPAHRAARARIDVVLEVPGRHVVHVDALGRIALLWRHWPGRIDEPAAAPPLREVHVAARVLLRPALAAFEEDERLVALRQEVVRSGLRRKAHEGAGADRKPVRSDAHGAAPREHVHPLLLDRVEVAVRARHAGLDAAQVHTHVRQARGVTDAAHHGADPGKRRVRRALLAGEVPHADHAGGTRAHTAPARAAMRPTSTPRRATRSPGRRRRTW